MTRSYAAKAERGATIVNPPAPLRRQRSRTRGDSDLVRLAFFLFWCLVFTIPWENLVVIPNLGTVAHLVGYVALGIGLLAVLDKGRVHPTTGGFLLLLVFAFWRSLSFLWTASPELTLIEIQTIFQMVAMVWLLHQLAFSRKRLLSIMQAYVLGTLVSSCDTFYQFLHGINPANQARFSATGFDPNELALMLVLSLPLSLYLSSSTSKQSLVWLYRVQFLLAASAVLLSASRGPFLAAAGLILILPAVFFRSSDKQKAALIFVGVLAAGFIIYLVPAASWTRLGSIGTEISTGTLNDRKIIWEAGLEVFRQNPIIGVGAGAFRAVVRSSAGFPYVAHNTFLSILVEQGLIGFGLFLALFVYSIRSCLRMPRFERALWLSMLLTLTIGIFSLTWEYRKPIWLIFGLISLQVCVANRSPKFSRARRPSARMEPMPGSSVLTAQEHP
ncbi:MAG TPA: O-antigen ligase family protein [Bryobacteraceae bacterium]|jgi:O-antigen ligase|nr:O-antigen ligase family protein [Bryobacteraceae bacterium]